jgi:hypothetical protein
VRFSAVSALRLEGFGRFVGPLHTLAEPAHDLVVVSQRNFAIGTWIIHFVDAALRQSGMWVLQQGLKLEALGVVGADSDLCYAATSTPELPGLYASEPGCWHMGAVRGPPGRDQERRTQPQLGSLCGVASGAPPHITNQGQAHQGSSGCTGPTRVLAA